MSARTSTTTANRESVRNLHSVFMSCPPPACGKLNPPDHDSGNLDRIQIVKGWVDASGKAQEKIYRGWGVTWYSFGGPGAGFLSIGPQKRYVNLYFKDGPALDDPDGLLEGSGKRLRHVKIRKPEDLKRRSLHALVRQAAKRERAA